jgi:hypothetical protein
MPITETKLSYRPDTSKPFWKETSPAEILAARATFQSLIDNGNVNYVTTLSDNGLIQTVVATFDTLETYSAVETAIGVALDDAYMEYAKNNNMMGLGPTNPITGRRMYYTQTGIDQPFTCTTVYTIPEDPDSFIEAMGTFIENNNNYGKLTNLTVLVNSLSLTHTYNNSADFTDYHYDDLSSLHQGWAARNATRTITYALVS